MKTFKQHLTELSKSTLGSYIKKSANSRNVGGLKQGLDMATKEGQAGRDADDKHEKKDRKRAAGISTAVKKLTKEETEFTFEVAPPGWEGTVKAMKKHKDISNPFALAWSMKNKGMKSHVKEGTVLEVAGEHGHMSDAAHELVLHADNDSHLHHSSHQPIIKNLAKKAKKGVYDPEKAKKLWGYHADRAAQNYHKHHGDKSQPWHKMFSVSDRKQAAAHWEHHHRDELHENTERV